MSHVKKVLDALCSHPVLAVLDFNKEFVVQADASEVGHKQKGE